MNKIFILLVSLFIVFLNLNAGNNNNAASFLNLGSGAQSASLGDANVSFTNSPDVMAFNPASIVTNTSDKISFNHSAYFEKSSYDTFYYVRKINDVSAFGLGLQYFSYGSIDETDPSGTKIGSYSPYDMAVSIGYAFNVKSSYKFFDASSVGFSIKYINMKVKDNASTIAGDLGFITQEMENRFRFGFSIQNLGSDVKFDKEKESLPLSFKLGLSYKIAHNFLALFDISIPKNEDTYFSLGTQYTKKFSDYDVSLRAGYNSSRKDVEGFSGFSVGTGVSFNKISIDYALMFYGDIGEVHRIGIGFNF